jgi:NADH dehydrogenase
MERRHRVVIVGAGFGGLAAAKALKRNPVDVEIIDANNFHLFQPFLYQVATAGLDSDDVAYAVRGVFRRQNNVNVQMANVTGVDLDARTVTLDRAGERAELAFDSLVVAAGAVSTDYGVDGVEEHAVALKTLDDALELRHRVLERFERAAADPRMIERGELNVVLCGGGPTGVETAGAMMELFTKVLAKDFPTLDVRAVRVILVEAAPRLLPAMSDKSGERARRTLTRRGVEVRLGVGVDRIVADTLGGVDRHLVHLADGSVIPAGVVVWAAGVRANPLAETLGVELTKAGRIVVNSDLTVPGHPDVYAIGDIAATPARGFEVVGVAAGHADTPAEQALLPQVAQPAIQGGRHAGRQIARRLDGLPAEAFHYHDKGTMATIGRHDAVTEFPNGRRLTGFVGWLAWLGLHILYLIGFRNRANVLVNWAWNYLTFDRGSRIIEPRSGDAQRSASRSTSSS